MEQTTVLLVDDDRNLLKVMSYHIREAGFRVIPTTSPLDALQSLDRELIDLVITDLRMPELDGLTLIRRIRAINSEIPVIVLTAFGTIDRAVEAVKIGASDFLSKPVEKAQIIHAIGKALQIANLLEENRRLSHAVKDRFEFSGIVGSSRQFREVIEQATQLAAVDTTVLIQGESGTGKELLARALHFNSERQKRPFVTVNCGAIPADLMESELFGYRKGAFTGANSDRKGKFEIAHTGTILLDEIGELPTNMQVKLLRVLQQREIDVIGDPHPRPVNIRVIAATNRDLQEMMRAGTFREDLFYRLSVAPLHIPPLRDRRDDIPLLVRQILDSLNGRLGKDVQIAQEAVDRLQDYNWPGNVRELENLLERLLVFNRSGLIRIGDLPDQVQQPLLQFDKVRLRLPEEGFSLEQLERDIIVAALQKHHWNQSQTARYLGITRNTLIYRMQKFALREHDAAETLDADSQERE